MILGGSRKKYVAGNTYIENVSEPWFTLIFLGLKKVEGRRNKGRFQEMKVGDIIKWTNSDFGKREFTVRITGKQTYGSFAEYLKKEGLAACLPGIRDIDQGVQIYYKYYTVEDEKEFGVAAIRMELI